MLGHFYDRNAEHPSGLTLTRRNLLRRGALGAAVLSVPGFLAACAGGDDDRQAGDDDTLRFSNWPLYIDVDPDTGKRPTLQQFRRETGIDVRYTEDINDNATFFGKIQRPLSQGRSIDRDLIVLTDTSRFPALIIERGWAEELDRSLIPNRDNLHDSLRQPQFDPARTYSLPWQSAMTGLASNLDVTKTPITDIDRVLEDRTLEGKVTFLTEMANSMSLVMRANGDDPSKVDDASFDRALRRIRRAASSGQIRSFTDDDYAGALVQGSLAVSMAWSGDAVQLTARNPRLRWELPDSGGDLRTDTMLIPSGGDVAKASKLMNFVYDPKVAAQIAAYVNFVSPVKGAREAIGEIDPKLADNPLVFPGEATLAGLATFDSEALDNEDYAEQWQDLITGKS